MSVNNINNWMFKKEAVKGTASIINTTTKPNLFGHMEVPSNPPAVGNKIESFAPYSQRNKNLHYGNREFPPINLQWCPTCPIAEFWFLGDATSAAPNTIQKKAVGTGYNPAITTRLEQKGGTQELLSQYVGCQSISYAERITDSDSGWHNTCESGMVYDEYEDNSGGSEVTQRDLCGASYQPNLIGDVESRYTEPPVITYDPGGGGEADLSAYIRRIEWTQSRAYKAFPTSLKKQTVSLGGYSEVTLQVWMIFHNTVQLDNVIDRATKDWSVKQQKSDVLAKYKTLLFKNVKYQKPEFLWQNEHFYLITLKMLAEYFTETFTLEDAITFATYFS